MRYHGECGYVIYTFMFGCMDKVIQLTICDEDVCQGR